MEITGSIVQVCTKQSHPKRDGSGNFIQQTFVIQTDGQYPKMVAFLLKGEERVNNFEKYNSIGQVVTVKYDPESREYNGKWYTDLTAYRIESVKPETQQVPQPATPNTQNVYPPVSVPVEGNDDQLPF